MPVAVFLIQIIEKTMQRILLLVAAWLLTVLKGNAYTYREKMVEAGDGFKLCTRIYLPDGEGPWPVVATRTPYVVERKDPSPLLTAFLNSGIGVIQQDCRGKGKSEGHFAPSVYERVDGLAFYQWLEKQPWCASIGIFGSSYTALTGWVIGDSLPSKVKAMYLSHYGVDRFKSCYQAGLFRQDIMSGWVIDNTEEPIKKPAMPENGKPGENYYDFYLHRPHVEADVDVLGCRLDYYRDWITHTDHADPYWDLGVWGYLRRAPQQIRVPMTVIVGQFDHHEAGTLLGYEMLPDETKAHSRLIVAAMNHFFQTVPTYQPHEHAADYNMAGDLLQWFKSILIDGIMPNGEVKVYNIGGDRWDTYPRWPIPVDHYATYFLSDSRQSGHRQLTKENTEKESRISYDYDPQNPVYAVGGETLFNSKQRQGCQLQPAPDFRPDVISFITEPVEEDLPISGIVKVMLRVSTDVDDTSFAVTLSEVQPDGTTHNIRDAITTLAYRHNPWGPRETYTPGETVDLELTTNPVFWTIKKGCSLRLDVKSTLFPEYAVHSNYAGVWANQAKTRVAHQTVFVGGKDGSKVMIPVAAKSFIFQKMLPV